MSDLSAKFAALESQLTDEQAATEAALASIQARLDEFSTTFDTMIANNAANTRYLIAALTQTDPCANCEQTPVLAPTVPGTSVPINTDTCQRAQAFLAAIAAFCSGYDTLVSYNVTATVSLINKTVSEVIAGLSSGDPVPLPSVTESINIAGNYFGYASANIFGTTSMTDALSSLYSDLLSAIYAAGSGSAAQSAYNAVVDGSTVPFPAANLLKATAYAALWSYYFDPDSTPDLSGYDGSVCSIPAGTCYDLTAGFTTASSGGSGYGTTEGFAAFSIVSTVATTDVDVTFTPGIFYNGNLAGWTWEVTSGAIQLQYRTGDTSAHQTFSFSAIIGTGSGVQTAPSTGCFAFVSGSPFTIRVCSPG